MMERKSIMWKYIAQEPEVLSRLMECEEIYVFANEVGRSLQAVYFVAHGSSFNAAVAVSDFMARAARIRVYAYTPGNFYGSLSVLAQEDPKTTLVATISQTGTSTGAIEALRRVNSLGFSTLGITEVRDSPVATEARWALPLLCGEENSNAKTKGYSATLLLLLLLSVALGLARGVMDESMAQTIRDELTGMIEVIPEIVKKVLVWCERTGFGESLQDLYVLGSGMNFGTAQEGQLKLMETMCIPTMFNDIGEFFHGMHRSITENSGLLLLRSRDAFAPLMANTFRYLKTITGHVLMLDATGEEQNEPDCISLPYFPETQSLLLTTLAVQVLSVYAPERVGKDPNRDANDDFTSVVQTRVK